MGNRSVITTEDKNIGVYLHLNGGMDSVEGFLEYCKRQGYVSPEIDNYGWARLFQVIGNFFGGTKSVGISLYENLDIDNGDNGVYVIRELEIIERLYYCLEEQREYDLEKFIKYLDNCMPACSKLKESKV